MSSSSLGRAQRQRNAKQKAAKQRRADANLSNVNSAQDVWRVGRAYLERMERWPRWKHGLLMAVGWGVIVVMYVMFTTTRQTRPSNLGMYAGPH